MFAAGELTQNPAGMPGAEKADAVYDFHRMLVGPAIAFAVGFRRERGAGAGLTALNMEQVSLILELINYTGRARVQRDKILWMSFSVLAILIFVLAKIMGWL